MIYVTFPNGQIEKHKKGITPLELAKKINPKLASNIISAIINNNQIEITTPIYNDVKISFLTWDDDLGKKVFWHSSAHLLAEAILYYYPNAKLAIGPPIDKGFYYDIDFENQIFQEKDFKKIELKIIENAKKNSLFNIYSVTKKEAIEKYQNNPYKIDLIQNLKNNQVITYCQHNNFTDLCKGLHLPSTGFIKAIKILNISGAYWKGNKNNKQLTRIYGISYPNKEELNKYLKLLEEIKNIDHRKIGKKLGLFTFSKKVGLGLPLWLPKGVILRNKLEKFLIETQKKLGYEMVITPHIGRKDLYLTSGHYEKYSTNWFQSIYSSEKNEEFILKPMSCPHHCEIYKSLILTYKDLPKRLAEFGTVYRYEQSGQLHGLTRVRSFTQDDAHIFCTPDQLYSECEKVIDLILHVFYKFNFNQFTIQISLKDKKNNNKYIGSDENWHKAEEAIIYASKNKKLNTIIKYGDAAFYGPKLDFMVKDNLGRNWQLGTIQIDYNLPERFNLQYIGSDGGKHRVVMIHRASFGSIERFIAILIEHTKGDLPIWLSFNSYIIIPTNQKYINYAKKVAQDLENYDICGSVDERNETMSKKIRDAEINKIPIMLIVGEQEEKDQNISIRQKKIGNVGKMNINEFIKYYNSLFDCNTNL